MLKERCSIAGAGAGGFKRKLPARCHRQSGFNLVRWIMVVTLGCSLGLLIVFVVLSAIPVHRNDDTMRIVHRIELKEPAFKLSEDEIENQLRQVIESQLTAFRQDDYARAYNFAGSALKTQVSLPAFERMVKAAYPVIAKSSAVQFGVILDNGEEALVNATIAGESGGLHHYQYILIRERSGWKIIAVNEVKSVGTTV
jgi:hypothetical protein